MDRLTKKWELRKPYGVGADDLMNASYERLYSLALTGGWKCKVRNRKTGDYCYEPAVGCWVGEEESLDFNGRVDKHGRFIAGMMLYFYCGNHPEEEESE